MPFGHGAWGTCICSCADLERAAAFYHAGLGLDQTVWSYPGALFLSAGGYHHHLGINTWATGAGAGGLERGPVAGVGGRRGRRFRDAAEAMCEHRGGGWCGGALDRWWGGAGILGERRCECAGSARAGRWDHGRLRSDAPGAHGFEEHAAPLSRARPRLQKSAYTLSAPFPSSLPPQGRPPKPACCLLNAENR